MISKSERRSWRARWGDAFPGTPVVRLLDYADDSDSKIDQAREVIAAMLKAAQMAGGGAYVRVAAAVPDAWMPDEEGAS